jgi:hypothetical protein
MALEPGLPRVVGDRTRLAEALSLLVTAAAAQSDQQKPLVVTTARDGTRAIVRIAPRGWTEATFVLASRLIEAQGGEARVADDALEVRVGQR